MPKFSSYRRKPGVKKGKKTYRKKVYKRAPYSLQMKSGVHFFDRTISMNTDNAVVTNWTPLYGAGGSSTAGMSIGGPANGSVALVTPTTGVVNNILYWSVGYKFNLSNITRLTEYTNLFDQYKLNKVVVKIIPYSNSVDSPAGSYSVPVAPFLHWCIDKDDSAPFTADVSGIESMQERKNYKMIRLADKGVSIVIRPCTLGYMDAAGAITPASVDNPIKWIDCAHPEVDHFGLKFIFEAVCPTAAQTIAWFRINTTYYLEFKGPR